MPLMDLRLWVLFASLFYVIDGLNFADIVKPCKKNDPNLDGCALEATNDLRPKLKKGIKALKIPSLDPMIIPKVDIASGNSGPVSLDSTFTNVHVEGLSNYQIKKVHVDYNKRQITAEAFVPVLDTKANTEIKGRILTLPLNGKGQSFSKYTGVDAFLTLKFKPETKDGKEYWTLEKSDFDFNVKHADIRLDNLFNGNKQLGDTMNTFIAENWQLVYEELKPSVRDTVNALIMDSVSKLFKAYPIDDLFPQ